MLDQVIKDEVVDMSDETLTELAVYIAGEAAKRALRKAEGLIDAALKQETKQ